MWHVHARHQADSDHSLKVQSRVLRLTPIISALGKLRKEGYHEFEINLGYIEFRASLN